MYILFYISLCKQLIVNDNIRIIYYSVIQVLISLSLFRLIALGLEQFIPYMDNFEAYKTKFKALRLADVAHFISKYMMPHKDAKKLYIHIKAMKDKKVQPNPIGYYFANNKAPTTLHYVVPLLEFGIMPPCMRQADTLPYQWKIFIYPETKVIVLKHFETSGIV